MEEIKQKAKEENWEVEFDHLFGYEIKEVQKEFPRYLSHDPNIKDFIKSTLSQALEKREKELWEEYEKLRTIHKLELDTVSLKSIEEFVVWKNTRLINTMIKTTT